MRVLRALLVKHQFVLEPIELFAKSHQDRVGCQDICIYIESKEGDCFLCALQNCLLKSACARTNVDNRVDITEIQRLQHLNQVNKGRAYCKVLTMSLRLTLKFSVVELLHGSSSVLT